MSVFLAFFQGATETVKDYTGIPAANEAIHQVMVYAPRIIYALLLLVLAWIVASIVRWVARRALDALGVDEKLSSAGSDSGSKIVKTLSDVVFWIVFLCFIPGILSVLGLHSVLEPIQGMLNKVWEFLPHVLGAGLILALGMLVANIVRQLITSFLTNIGIDSFAEKHSVKTDFTEGGLSGLIGTIIYAIILIAILSAALNVLQIEALSRPIEGVVNNIFNAIPNIFGATILLVLAYIIAKIIRGIVTDVLAGLGFNKLPNAIGLSKLPTEGDRSASAFVGHIAFLAIMFFAATEAAKLLNFADLSATINDVAEIAFKILAGIVVLVIGMYIANLVANLIKDSGVSNSDLLSTIARIAILFFVGAMALKRMNVADDIVEWAFILLLGALAVAFAIAFGIGGRDFARDAINKMSAKMDDNNSNPSADE